MLNRLDRARLLRMGMREDDFAAYGFGAQRPLADEPDYLGYSLYRNRVRPALNAPGLQALTENKWVFYRMMSFGVPIPETLGLYHPMFGVSSGGDRLRTAADVLRLLDARRPSALVVKPAGGHRGAGVLILRDVDYATGMARTQHGDTAVLADAIEALPTDDRRGYPGYVVQVAADQHPFLEALSPYTANTVRVMTLLTDGGVVVQAAVLRLGRAGRMADNWDQGAVAVTVDLATGVLGDGLLKQKHGGQRVLEHPDNGVSFTGKRLPSWDAVLEICRRAAVLLPGVRSIGWDVLLTADGPILIEANGSWGLHMFQVHTSGLLADEVFRRELELAGVPLPEGLPSRLSTLPALARSLVAPMVRKARSTA